jgi:hypothetical protein
LALIKVQKKRFLYGAYGAGNLGDDLILRAALAQYWKSEDTHESLRVISFGRPQLQKYPEFMLQPSALENSQNLFSADSTLHFCGGGLFWDASHCDEMLRLAEAQRLAGGSVYVERIGAQGFHCNPGAVRSLLELAGTVSVRDQNSVDLLRRYGVFENATREEDFVLTLKINRAKFIQKTALPTIAINHAPTLFYSDVEHRIKIIRFYTALAREFSGKVQFVYLPMVRHRWCIDQNDVLVGEEISVGSGGLVRTCPPFDTAEALLECFPKFVAVVGWRYHLFVLAKLHGIAACFFGEMEEHKYLAFVKENNMSLVDFNLPEDESMMNLSSFIVDVLKKLSRA